MLVGAYLFPLSTTLGTCLLVTENPASYFVNILTSRIIFEEIHMIDLYFHKLNQSYLFTLNFCHAYRNDSMLFVSKRSDVVPKMTQASFLLSNLSA